MVHDKYEKANASKVQSGYEGGTAGNVTDINENDSEKGHGTDSNDKEDGPSYIVSMLDVPFWKVREYQVLMKVSRTRVEGMLKQVGLPMRPCQNDSHSQLCIRLLRRVANLDPVSADFDVFPD